MHPCAPPILSIPFIVFIIHALPLLVKSAPPILQEKHRSPGACKRFEARKKRSSKPNKKAPGLAKSGKKQADSSDFPASRVKKSGTKTIDAPDRLC